MLQRNNHLKKYIAPFFTYGEVKQLFLYMLEAKTIRKPRKSEWDYPNFPFFLAIIMVEAST